MRLIINLFSIFDPTSRFSLELNWLVVFVCLMVFPFDKWIKKTRVSLFFSFVINSMRKEIFPLFPNKSKRALGFLLSIFFFIILENSLGLVPYVFTSTRHLSITFRLSLPLWLRYFFWGWKNRTKKILAHLVPNSTPNILMPFIVIIEIIRSLIRPLTLAVRLTANLIAGHLLLTLISNTVGNWEVFVNLRILGAQRLLILLEIAVAIIQAYVFAILIALYVSEV